MCLVDGSGGGLGFGWSSWSIEGNLTITVKLIVYRYRMCDNNPVHKEFRNRKGPNENSAFAYNQWEAGNIRTFSRKFPHL